MYLCICKCVHVNPYDQWDVELIQILKKKNEKVSSIVILNRKDTKALTCETISQGKKLALQILPELSGAEDAKTHDSSTNGLINWVKGQRKEL